MENESESNRNSKRLKKSLVETQKQRMNGKNIAEIID
jgi:hypothetical protein